jgi:hypothetical protein
VVLYSPHKKQLLKDLAKYSLNLFVAVLAICMAMPRLMTKHKLTTKEATGRKNVVNECKLRGTCLADGTISARLATMLNVLRIPV